MTTGGAVRVLDWRLVRVLQQVTRLDRGEPKSEPLNLSIVAADVVEAIDAACSLARQSGAFLVEHRGTIDLGPIDGFSTRAAQEAARTTRTVPEGPRVIT